MKLKKWVKFFAYAKEGDWQLHTSITDGKSSIDEIFRQAQFNDLKFLHFSEHVRKEISYDYLKFKEHVYAVGSRYSNMKFAVGAESKVIDTSGNLDISDEVAKEAEIITFSFHSAYFKTKEEYIKAICAAAQNELSDIWGHPTSYHNWLGFKMEADDWLTVANSLNRCQVVYEINKRYERPELEELRIMKEHQVAMVYSSDAHHFSELLTKTDISEFNQLLGS
jgi:putative hydrolase